MPERPRVLDPEQAGNAGVDRGDQQHRLPADAKAGGEGRPVTGEGEIAHLTPLALSRLPCLRMLMAANSSDDRLERPTLGDETPPGATRRAQARREGAGLLGERGLDA